MTRVREISRRELLRVAGLGAAAIASAGQERTRSSANTGDTWADHIGAQKATGKADLSKPAPLNSPSRTP